MYIYCIINLLNGKRYVGQTTRTLEQRFKEHCKSRNSAIGQAIAECGVENFRIELIEECKTIEQLNAAEQYWIEKFNCRIPKGYNVREGGFGFVHKSRTIVEPLKRFRRDFKLSQKAVAEKLGMKQQLYSSYESPKNPVTPSVNLIINLAKSYDVSADYLLGLTDEPRPLKAEPAKVVEQPADDIESLKERVTKLETAFAKFAG